MFYQCRCLSLRLHTRKQTDANQFAAVTMLIRYVIRQRCAEIYLFYEYFYWTSMVKVFLSQQADVQSLTSVRNLI